MLLHHYNLSRAVSTAYIKLVIIIISPNRNNNVEKTRYSEQKHTNEQTYAKIKFIKIRANTIFCTDFGEFIFCPVHKLRTIFD